MRHRIISILWLLANAVVGESGLFAAEFQFRHHRQQPEKGTSPRMKEFIHTNRN